MQINLFEHPELVHGAYSLDADEQGWILDRFTPEFHQFYDTNDHIAIRVACTSGVRLAFRTDSRTLALGLVMLEAAREVFAVDVAVDGAIQTFRSESGLGEFAFSAELPGEGEREVEIHLPHLCVCRLQMLVLDDGATLKPVRRTGRGIAFIGDSITQGMTCSTPARAYATRIAHALDKDFVNLSVGGAILRPEVAKLAKKYEWDTAVLAFGANDCAQGIAPEVFSDRAETAIRELAKRGTARIFVITPIVMIGEGAKNVRGLNLSDYRRLLSEAATAVNAPNVTVIDGRQLVPNNANRFADGLHPNDSGMEEYFKNLLPQM